MFLNVSPFFLYFVSANIFKYKKIFNNKFYINFNILFNIKYLFHFFNKFSFNWNSARSATILSYSLTNQFHIYIYFQCLNKCHNKRKARRNASKLLLLCYCKENFFYYMRHLNNCIDVTIILSHAINSLSV